LIAAIASFGWVQKKWQSGGAEQFWRETVMTSSRESVTLLEPELIELRTLTQYTSGANRFVFKAN